MLHVLLVDDDSEIRELLAELLVSAGFGVDVAANGVEALACLKSHRPSVVILDLMMPVMSGWQLRARMLEDESLSAIPVIVVSGAGDLCESSAALGAREVFAKPVAWPTLLAALRKHG
jgi:CheY-like chemotaxis protein